MMKGILFFIVVWVVCAILIYLVKKITKSEAWSLFKCSVFGLSAAILAVGFVSCSVFLF